MLSSLTWVPKGAAKAIPKKEVFDPSQAPEDDMDEDAMVEEAMNQGFDDEEDDENAEQTTENQTEESMQAEQLDEDARIVKEYNLDDYDNEEDNVGKRLLSSGLQEVATFNNQEDPYMKDKIVEDDDLSDIEDVTIRPTDCVLIGVHSEEDISHLDVYIYEEQEDNLYVHHDILLGAFPLCVEWIACNPKSSISDDGSTNNNSSSPTTGNFAAVGTFEPCIEIWDLDLMDAVEPVATLGGTKQESASKQKLKKKFKKKIPSSYLPGSHESAVMGLSWNKLAGQYLASCSADTTVKVWDLTTQQCGQTFNHHRDKVQSIQWHPTEASVLCCGSYDRTCSIFDVRYPNAVKLTSKLPADTEHLQWSTNETSQFYVSTENGNLLQFDMRSLEKPVWTLAAHSKPCSSFSINPQIPSLIVTASVDKTVKFWDLGGNAPACIHTAKTNSAVFSIGFCKDSPLLLAVGSEGEGDSQMDEEAQSDDKRLAVWNISNIANVAQKYNLKPTK